MNRALDLAAAGLLVLYGLFATVSGLEFGVWQSGQPGAGMMPTFAGIALCLLGIASALFDPIRREAVPRGAVLRPLGYMAALLAFGPMIEFLGTSLAIVIAFFVMLRLVERASWRTTILVTLAAVVVAKVLFQLILQVPLPDMPFGFGG